MNKSKSSKNQDVNNLVKFIFGRLKSHKKLVLLCSFILLWAAILTVVAPIILGYGIDQAISKHNLTWALLAIFAYICLLIITSWMRYYTYYQSGILANLESEKYFLETTSELIQKPLSFHYDSSGQKTMDAMSSFRWGFSNFIQGVVFDLLPGLVTVLAMIIYITFLDFRISLVLLVSIVGLIFYFIKISSYAMERFEDRQKAQNATSSIARDALTNILIVKSTSNEKMIHELMTEKNIETAKCNQIERYGDYIENTHENLIIKAGTLGALSFMVVLAVNGGFSYGKITAILAYVFGIYGYVQFTQWVFNHTFKAAAEYKLINEALVNVKNEDTVLGQDINLKGGVEFKNVHFKYLADRNILAGASFKVGSGEVVAIVGKSGEGKTTIVDLLGRYYVPEKGEILFDGIESTKINLASLRQQMAYVPQDLSLFRDTIEMNIRYGRHDANDEEIMLAVKQAGLEEFISKLPDGIKTIVGERGLKLSGGERQRVALARAFLRNPKVLILDEPTSQLDSKTEKIIQESLVQLMSGRTTFIIAHRLRTVRNADKILVLQDGVIAESGRHDDLIKLNGVYAEFLQEQQDRLI